MLLTFQKGKTIMAKLLKILKPMPNGFKDVQLIACERSQLFYLTN
jgi:hypothetical protein